MNIFYLSHSPKLAARFQCDKHVVKMALESVQLLSNCYPDARYYKHTHWNHPSAIWTRANLSNFLWLLRHAKHLCMEYTHRYGKRRELEDIVDRMTCDLPPLPDGEFYPPPQCMPEEFKRKDTVKAYRAYYKVGKAHLLTYTNRDIPSFLQPL